MGRSCDLLKYLSLQKQQTQLKQMLEESNVQKSDAEQKKEEAVKHLSQRNQQDSNVVGQLKAIVAEKESKVKQLEQELQQLQKDKIQVRPFCLPNIFTF